MGPRGEIPAQQCSIKAKSLGQEPGCLDENLLLCDLEKVAEPLCASVFPCLKLVD